jgi:acetyl esterase/lipase
MSVSEDRSVLTRSARPADRVVPYGPEALQDTEVRDGRDGAARPLVVVIHGGFWRPDIDRTHARPMAEAIAAAGWTVALPEYRRVPGDPSPTLRDLTQLLAHASGLPGLHNGRVVVAGHSAGGHLALWAAAARVCPAIIGTLALAPVADLLLAHRLGLGDGAVVRFLGVDPLERADIDPCRMPAPAVATTLVQGAEDEIVPPVVCESYRRAHPLAQVQIVPRAGHFALIDPLSPVWTTVLAHLSGLAAGSTD